MGNHIEFQFDPDTGEHNILFPPEYENCCVASILKTSDVIKPKQVVLLFEPWTCMGAQQVAQLAGFSRGKPDWGFTFIFCDDIAQLRAWLQAHKILSSTTSRLPIYLLGAIPQTPETTKIFSSFEALAASINPSP